MSTSRAGRGRLAQVIASRGGLAPQPRPAVDEVRLRPLVVRRRQSERTSDPRSLDNGTMPCDGAWPGEQITAFKRWLQSGMSP
jgi:hypothetical protein